MQIHPEPDRSETDRDDIGEACLECVAVHECLSFCTRVRLMLTTFTITSWPDRLMPRPVSSATIPLAGSLFTIWYRSCWGTPNASAMAAWAVSSSALVSPGSRP